MGLQKRGRREEVSVLTTSSLSFICHPLQASDKKTHRLEMEVLVNENETFLDAVYTSTPLKCLLYNPIATFRFELRKRRVFT
jgi:hypothetical protein